MPSSRTQVSALLVDDEELVRVGLRAILESCGEIVVVGEAPDGSQVVPLIRERNPDVVIMDVRMPKVDGLAAIREILREVAEPPKILVLTTFELDDYVYEALRGGASGFLLKRARPEEIIQAVRTIARSDILLFPEAIRHMAGSRRNRAAQETMRRAALTDRESEVLRLISEGLSNNEIASRLYLGAQTVKTHVSSVLAKLGARDRTQAVIIAYESGFVGSGKP
ncbi:DNA-binding response regulator, NarL/FixJ family, contains REC and HTH domains [Parafrankia irregularis]|uniref:DNA-binding response regulator, NarL/FixJ family, contains REC and HTH domains n=1 Tax=Parafrankia irregularis TaxID=795642 RepID=A0A0S4QEX6_9ACTN|nr:MULTISPECIES: response regulator transcription factor [Parafrankia]MBE3203270.1 response regulator transcription factor [Parafrankia sp. CH37]CUU54081.1 DNA-binding response regulator, NarL/FixJ family, contains REC and HTH domains [Parafrankia irregularis]